MVREIITNAVFLSVLFSGVNTVYEDSYSSEVTVDSTIRNSDIPDIKIRILNFTRTNNGFSMDQASRHLGIPLNVVRQAVAELQADGLLQRSPTLKLGRRQG